MKYLFAFAVIFATFNSSATTSTATNESTTYHYEDNDKKERYVIVYTINGVTHAVIINHYVDCANLNPPSGVTINDCGPVGQVVLPDGINKTEEAEALIQFELEAWPT